MMYRQFIPNNLLTNYVDYYYFLKGDYNQYSRTFIPDTRIDITFNFDSEVKWNENQKEQLIHAKSIIYASKQETCLFTFNKIEILGIRFFPLGFFSLFHTPSIEIVNEPVELNLVFGSMITEIEQKLFDANSIEKRVEILNNWLIHNLINKKPVEKIIEYTIRQMYKTKGIYSINELLNNDNSEYKKIQRWFNTFFGISPKTFSRIIRFDFLHNDLRKFNSKEPDWLSLVAKYNFYDQSHLIKEFQHFTGKNPTEFFNQIEKFI